MNLTLVQIDEGNCIHPRGTAFLRHHGVACTLHRKLVNNHDEQDIIMEGAACDFDSMSRVDSMASTLPRVRFLKPPIEGVVRASRLSELRDAPEENGQGEGSSRELVENLGLPILTLSSNTPILDNLFLGLGLLMKLLPRTVPALRVGGRDTNGFFGETFSELLQRGQAGSWRALSGVICSRHSV